MAQAGLAEMIVATGPTGPDEDRALVRALTAYREREKASDHSMLAAFVRAHPKSGWTPAVLTNLGLAYLHDGYFSRAAAAWQAAWEAGKDATEPQARALVDRAVGELIRLHAALGQVERLSALLDEIGDRRVTGGATEMVQHGREVLWQLKNDPRHHLFNCGPVALAALMVEKGVDTEAARNLRWYRPGPNGTNLAEVARLAEGAEFRYRLIFRRPGQEVPTPALVHWKVGHFSTIAESANGRFRLAGLGIQGREMWVTAEALDAEASGYFLVPAEQPVRAQWREVAATETSGVWGRGPSFGAAGVGGDLGAGGGDPRPGFPPPAGPGQPPGCKEKGGMCRDEIKESSVSLTLFDAPVGYTPPIGPAAWVRIVYNQREESQPANFTFFNVSPKWTLDWLTYVTDDPANAGAGVTRYIAGGGSYSYTGYSGATGQFAAQLDDGSILVRTVAAPITYERRFRDGRIEVYGQSDGAPSYPRNVFLTKVIDSTGNMVTLTYDAQNRLTVLTDATGRQTTFSYGQAGRPLVVTAITDPFGRRATLTYDNRYRLSSITDTIGLTSSFTYDENDLVNAMTTPYGTTTFAFNTGPDGTNPGVRRFLQVTDPMGFSEREEWREGDPPSYSGPTGEVPSGMPVAPANQALNYRNSFYWDKAAYVQAGCTPAGGCDYSLARLRHFLHVAGTAVKSNTIESIKYPLENRIWYSYPGQGLSINTGTSSQPIAIGRVLDNGTSQVTKFAYDTAGTFNLTEAADPLGRKTTLTYAANGIDLTLVRQTIAGGAQETLAQVTYNTKHQPLVATDAAGQTTTYTYNAAGQVATVTNALNQTTSFTYDAAGNLITVTNANNATASSFTYDAFARVATVSDSEGWTVAYQYDAADRVTRVTYPDGTQETRTYNKLDLASYRNRQGLLWLYNYDANSRLTSVIDPTGSQMKLGYNQRGQVTSLTDPRGNVTQWTYDIQGRVTSKIYPDATTVTYTYENTTSRLKSITDALGQVKQFTYGLDNRVTAITYVNAVNPTPNVAYSYDAYYPRRVSMTDGTGTTTFAYVSVGTLGALKLAQEVGPLASSTIAYTYDALGRLATRSVAGSGTESYSYDAIGRLSATTNDLGAFTLSYLGQTGQVTLKQKTGSTLATAWSYLANSADRRLSGINNTGLTAGQFSNFALTTNAESQITAITETADTTPVYPAAGSQAATYNNLNQLTNLASQALTYDANGNLLSDGQRNYAWDAERRLVRITYPGQAGKQSDFSYDGQDRRTAIIETPTGGGTPVTTRYLWCDGDICQARNVGNTVIRSYHDDGEYLPGTPATTLFYGTDQVGSVRRVFTSTTVAPAFAYDPYGVPLQGTAPATDYGFAGMFRHGPSGLNLTRYRAYDPVAGRWLSRDPLGEGTDPAGNLYAYVGGDPIANIDPSGDFYGPVAKFVLTRTVVGRVALSAGEVVLRVIWGYVIVREARWVGSELHCLIWLGPQIKPNPTLVIGRILDDALSSEGSEAQGKAENEERRQCRLIDGTIVPVGTIGYRWDKLPITKVQHGIAGDHLNLYEAHQNPKNGRCFWVRARTVSPPPQPDWIKMLPFAN